MHFELDGREQASRWKVMKFPGGKGASFPVESDEVSRLERSKFPGGK